MSGSMPNVAWHISSKSDSNGGSCVEAGPILDGSGRVAVRDTKDRAAAALVYPADGWTAFVGAVKHGEFGHTTR
ncbi:DUF397 domain-containing protein [Micromonospora acroterricola]|uniref:DUF397 domain-containing protein n=1 Tax=Micromonospora acroterricola TaxID=2202421 RepID=A0A317CTF0_9ACTN|nr:DUF397 domain-containing protein [Micromonospora acroterricola]PWR05841.1 DUF397 domain-containing protein [Micromonospora acroterricola]